MNRRGFLKVAFAAGIATAVPLVIGENLPTIYGDGIHDDAEGLQTALDGKAVHCRVGAARIADCVLDLSGGKYLISKTLHLHRKAGVTFANAHLVTAENFDGKYAMFVHNDVNDVRIEGCIFDMRSLPLPELEPNSDCMYFGPEWRYA